MKTSFYYCVLAFILIIFPAYGISDVNHVIDGKKLTLTYKGTPPFYINIRPDVNIGLPGGYLWAKTYSNSFSYNLEFANNPSKTYYYGVSESSLWSKVNTFQLANFGITGCFEEKYDGYSCYSCKKNNVPINNYCYNQLECENSCKVLLSYKCNLYSDCDDNKSTTADFCEEPSTINSFCTNNLVECSTLINNGNGDRNVDIVFIPENFTKYEIENMRSLYLQKHIDRLLGVEPFKSNSNRFNFYAAKTSINLGYSRAYVDVNIQQKIKTIAEICSKKYDFAIALPKKVSNGISNGGGGLSFLYSVANNSNILIHEFGHAFGGLSDEYFGERDTSYLTSPNCDVYGCPKWCRGLPINISNTKYDIGDCSNANDIAKCDNTLTPEGVPCRWIDYELPHCKERAGSESSEQFNSGSDCLQGTGCYNNCYGKNGWRPVIRDTIMIEASNVNSFDPVSEKHLKRVLNCCYPQSCDNFPIDDCKALGREYPAYGKCTSCS